MGIEHTPKEAVDNSSVQPRKPGLRPDNPGSPDQPSRLQSLARAREPAQSQNADEEQAGAVSKDRPAEEGLLAGGAENDDLSAWIAAAEQHLGKPEPTAADGEDSTNDTEERIEVAADRLDIPDDLSAVVEYGRPHRTDEGGEKQALPLFDGIPKREDARQGALGDCGVIAAMGAVAGTVPDKIQSSVRDNEDGTVTVSLHETEFKDGDVVTPTGRILDITVTKDVPVLAEKPGEAAFARCTNAGVTWPGYIEKALGAVDETWPPERGQNPLLGNPAERGYARLDKGTGAWTQAEILAQLTGRPACVDRLNTDPGAAADNEAVLTSLVESGRPTVVSTVPDFMQRADPKVYKLRCQHAYELIGVEDGKALLRNPYGHKHPDPVPVAEFTKHFNSYYAALEGETGGG
ncbi:hypothetical protein OG979_24595 [Actinomadura citrea]|uniref:hypothetical protein n=1 Tax=Actinomadura citrea TaxID=46158 RepID=UPI002E2C73BB|nr:hypothetical protein [Actinomadura citrea]